MTTEDGQNRGMSRRQFVKVTAGGALAWSALPTIIGARHAAGYQPGGRIHPNMDPLRVVGITDPAMVSGANPSAPVAAQDQMVVADVIGENIDRMALALAEERNVSDAWKKILVKPAGKSWSDVVVAVKINQIAQPRIRPPVVGKVCHVLTDVLGVKGSNIHVYDARNGSGIQEENRFRDLPEGVHLADKWGGITTKAPIPVPWPGDLDPAGLNGVKEGQGAAPCAAPLAEGKVDILVNIALSKGHRPKYGGFTMTCKNHYGTFHPFHGTEERDHEDATDYLLAINKSEAILGQQDERGSVTFPRQQLCIVDAIWAIRRGMAGNPNAQPNALFIGTFGPAVDFQVATKFRKARLGWPVDEGVVSRFLTDFGFAEQNLPGDGQIIDAGA